MCRSAGMLLHINGESAQWENGNRLFCRKVLFLTTLHCQFRGVGQGMKHTYMYPWFLYFKLNGIDVINEITHLELFSERTLSI